MKRKNTELRVGIFVVVALALGGALVFLIGDRRHLFESKVTYFASFKAVGGLASGSPVRIAGVTVGNVGEVKLGRAGKIFVSIKVVDSATHLVTAESIASLSNKGLLGDKLLDISAGRGTELKPGGWIRTEEPAEMSEYLAKAGKLLADVEATARNLRTATTPLGDPEFGQDIRSMTHNLAVLLGSISGGNGAIPRLFSDRALGAKLDSTLANVQSATNELSQTLRSVRGITDEVRSGKGSAHEIIYGEAGAKLARNLADATGEVALMLRQVRTKRGTAHDLIYENKADELIQNLTSASADVKAITQDVRAGRGTVGAFLKDPSVYEDVKRLVGDLERNEILRALVRYSIRNDEKRPSNQGAVKPAE